MYTYIYIGYFKQENTICCNQWSQATFFVAMARIARRSLRIHGLPLFSLGHPWSSVVKLGETEGLKCKLLDLLFSSGGKNPFR